MALRENIKIMVVDDMSTSRGLLIQPLEKLGVKNIDFRRDGKSALTSLVNSPAHLVISDYNMRDRQRRCEIDQQSTRIWR